MSSGPGLMDNQFSINGSRQTYRYLRALCSQRSITVSYIQAFYEESTITRDRFSHISPPRILGSVDRESKGQIQPRTIVVTGSEGSDCQWTAWDLREHSHQNITTYHYQHHHARANSLPRFSLPSSWSYSHASGLCQGPRPRPVLFKPERTFLFVPTVL